MLNLWKALLIAFILTVFMGVCYGRAEAADDRVRLGITVYANERKNGINEQDAQIITNALTDGLAGTRNVRIYERRQIDAALEELHKGGTAIIDESTAVEVGKMAGLQFILTASMTSLGRTENTSSMIIIKGSQTTVEESLEVNIRMIDVETGEVKLSMSQEGSAKETYTNIGGLSSSKASGALRTKAVRNAMPELVRRIRNELSSYTVQVPSYQPASRPATGGEIYYAPAEGLDFDPNESDQAKVIETYPISPGERNMLIIGHNNAYTKYKNRKYKEAYTAFMSLADDYAGNYLAAYWAGQSALMLKQKSYAREYFERAIKINPGYVPARRALEKL
ncbi:MAG: hypothetical protein LBS53_08995 [Synergistaceae bacterium]|jgi:curli biogenesis system outer membrane secretion channel CsgG|nr:hypothetical protein [Synergistaceae bacterium]